MTNFEEDLQVGELAEDWVADTLAELWGVEVVRAPKGCRHYDLLCGQWKVEVKYAREPHKFLPIEYEYKGHPSGIKGTQSDWWVWVFRGQIWLARTGALCSWLARNHGRLKKTTGGDGGNAKYILLPLEEVPAIFKMINT